MLQGAPHDSSKHSSLLARVFALASLSSVVIYLWMEPLKVALPDTGKQSSLLRMFVVSKSVFPWQDFPAKSYVCRLSQPPTLECNS